MSTRVHGDEYPTGGAEVDLSSLEDESLGVLTKSLQYRQNLLCHHRQNFNVDSVELIETAPRSRLEEEGKRV